MDEEASESDLAPGTLVLSRYRILGKLTQGGMAEVYLARQDGPAGYQKLIVIKRVRPHLANDEDFVAMFVNEARLAALINHPNVVQIFDLGQDGENWFLAMEFLDGRDMLQVGRACRSHNKAVPFDVTARIIADVCSGLEHAHKLVGADGHHLNLVHRDMSPENVLITFEGQVKVVDFGIAKARDNAFRTQAGQIKGKLGYVAPEAILGKPLDGRADIFAIGATLYLFLCGRPAFAGSNPMEIFEKSLKPPTPPRQVNKRVPEAMDAICMRCLAQDRDKRFANCGELRQALENHLAKSGRPLGPPQLAQFMRILFPPDKDPVRQRIEGLIAAPLPDLAPAPIPRAVTVEQSIPSPLPAPSPLYDDEKTQIAPHNIDIPTADTNDVHTAAPSTVEFGVPSSPPPAPYSDDLNVATVELDANYLDVVMESAGAPPPNFTDDDDGIDISMSEPGVSYNSSAPPPISASVEGAYEPDPPPFSQEIPPHQTEGISPAGEALFDTAPPPAIEAPSGPPIPQAGPPIPAVGGPVSADAATAMLQPNAGLSAGALFTEQAPTESTEPTPRAPGHQKPGLIARFASFGMGAAVGLFLLLGGLYAGGQVNALTLRLGVKLPLEIPPPPWLLEDEKEPVLKVAPVKPVASAVANTKPRTDAGTKSAREN